MGHPIIDEFCRAGELRPGKLREFQRHFRDVIQPLLTERDELATEVERLRTENAALKQAPKGTKRKEVADAVPA
jgi:hypothetical protein